MKIAGNARTWWQFAITSILETDIRRKAKEWSWAHMKTHRALLRQYKAAYVNKLSKPKNKVFADRVTDLEQKLDVVNIVLVRRQAESEVTQRESPEHKKKEKKAGGWFSWAWSSSTEGDADEDDAAAKVIGDFKKEMTDEEKEKLYEAIGYGEGAPITDFPEKFAAHLLNFNMDAIRLVIFDDNKSQKIIDASLSRVAANVKHRPTSGGIIIDSSIGTMQVTGINNLPMLKEDSVDDMLSVKAEINLVERDFDYGVDIKAKGLRCVYDLSTLTTLMDMLAKPEDISLRELEHMAELKLTELKERSEKQIQRAINNSVFVNIDIEPSFFILPGHALSAADKSVARESCPAVIFNSAVKVDLKMVDTVLSTSGKLDQIQLAIINMNRYELNCNDIDAYILQPCTLEFHATLNFEQNTKRIAVNMGDLRITISPNMVQVLTSILSEIGTTSQSEADGKGALVKYTTTELFKPKPIESAEHWFLKNEIYKAKEVTADMVLYDTPDESPTHRPDGPINDQLMAGIKEITIILESGGVASRPMIKLVTSLDVVLDDWSRLSLSTDVMINYYNGKLITWEPLIEPLDTTGRQVKPWSCFVNATIGDKISATLESTDQLEMTVTKTGLDVITGLGDAFGSAVKNAEKLDTEPSSVQIRNYLGRDVVIYADSTKYIFDQNVKKLGNKINNFEAALLQTSQRMTLVQKDTLKVDDDTANLLVSISVDTKEVMRTISLAHSCRRVYDLPIASYPLSKMTWVLDVATIDIKRKVVTFGSTVEIVNNLDSDLHLFSLPSADEAAFLTELKSQESYSVPLEIVGSIYPTVLVKPAGENYCIPNQGVSWRNMYEKTFKQKTIVCEDKKSSQHPIFLQAAVMSSPTLFEDTAHATAITCKISINAPLTIQNVLPLPIKCNIVEELEHGRPGDKPKVIASVRVEAGQKAPLFHFDPSRPGTIEVCVENYLKHNWVSSRKIDIRRVNEDQISTWMFRAYQDDTSNLLEPTIHLDISVMRSKTDRSVSFALFAPFWIVNKTGRTVTWRSKDLTMRQKPTTELPLLFAFKPNTAKKLSLQIGNSAYSEFFSIDAVGSKGNTICKDKESGTEYYASVEVELSSFQLSKVVTLKPFYSIINRTSLELDISDNEREWVTLKPFSQRSLWPSNLTQCNLHFKKSGYQSRPIRFKETNQVLLALGDDLINILVDVNDNEVKIQVTDYYPGAAPLKIFNATASLLHFKQNSASDVNVLEPRSYVYYTWPEPSGQREIWWKTPSTSETVVVPTLDAAGTVDDGQLFWVAFLDGKQRTLVITEDFEVTNVALQSGEFTKPKVRAHTFATLISVALRLPDLDNHQHERLWTVVGQ